MLRFWVVLGFTSAALSCGGRVSESRDASPVGHDALAETDGDAALDAPSDAALDEASDAALEGPSDAASPQSVFKLSETAGVRLQVASDRTGQAVVMWTDPLGPTRSVRWNAAEGSWLPLEAFDGDRPFLVQPNGSGRPLMNGRIPEPGDAGTIKETVRRFDPGGGMWSALVDFPPPPSYENDRQLAVDPGGNAHSFWRNAAGNTWSWWRAGGAAWEPTVPFDEVHNLVAAPAATFMWFARNALGVRRFDAAAGIWSEAAQLADLTQESSLRIHWLVVGRDGAPLMVSLRRDPGELAVGAWHGAPGTNSWGARELVETVPVSSNPSSLSGPIGALADPVHDFFWVPVPLADGSFDGHVHRYDPAQRAWAPSRVLHSDVGTPRLDLRADGAGRVYGCSGAGVLMRFDRDTLGWQDTPAQVGGGIIRASDNGAFVVGFADGDHLVAFRSDAGGAWRAARGYPGGARPSVGSVAYAMEIAGPV